MVRNHTPLGVITEKGIVSYLYKEIGESLDEIRTSKAITKHIISVRIHPSMIYGYTHDKKVASHMFKHDRRWFKI